MRDPFATVKDLVQRRRRATSAGIPEGQRVYAIGDIHGRADLLHALHAQIAADAADADANMLMTAVYLGDYVDRGPDSKGVIDALLASPLPGFEAVHLKGNHEDLMLEFLADPAAQGQLWLFNGGDATARSYGVAVTDEALDRMQRLREELNARIPPAHFEFLSRLSLAHEVGDYLFVHAGIRPGVALDRQSEQDLIWIRDEFLRSAADHGKVVVHGHTPMHAPEVRANRISIDTAAYATDVLTCLVLEGTERRFLMTGE
ncbi:MAG: metallophosphoesterase family protein [Alphaproteobacteria bacterium]